MSIIFVYALYNAAYAALSCPAGMLSDRMPRRIVFATGMIVSPSPTSASASSQLRLGLAPASGLRRLHGVYRRRRQGLGGRPAPGRALGTGLGLFQGIAGGCALIASLWAGLLWSGDGRLPLQISGAVVGLLAVALLVAGRRLDARAPVNA